MTSRERKRLVNRRWAREWYDCGLYTRKGTEEFIDAVDGRWRDGDGDGTGSLDLFALGGGFAVCRYGIWEWLVVSKLRM